MSESRGDFFRCWDLWYNQPVRDQWVEPLRSGLHRLGINLTDNGLQKRYHAACGQPPAIESALNIEDSSPHNACWRLIAFLLRGSMEKPARCRTITTRTASPGALSMRKSDDPK